SPTRRSSDLASGSRPELVALSLAPRRALAADAEGRRVGRVREAREVDALPGERQVGDRALLLEVQYADREPAGGPRLVGELEALLLLRPTPVGQEGAERLAVPIAQLEFHVVGGRVHARGGHADANGQGRGRALLADLEL